MKRTLITALLVLSLGATPAMAGPTLKQRLAATKATVAKLQSQLKKARSAAEAQHDKDAGKIADMRRAHLMDSIALGQRDNQILALQTQITQRTTAGVETVLAGSTADIYSAVQQIWNAFPLRPSGQTCGYDKSSHVTIDFPILVSSTYTFSFDQC
jgi:hypothetical protein